MAAPSENARPLLVKMVTGVSPRLGLSKVDQKRNAAAHLIAHPLRKYAAKQMAFGQITRLHPGDDSVVRVVTVWTSTSSELIRSLVKIVLLPEASDAIIAQGDMSD